MDDASMFVWNIRHLIPCGSQDRAEGLPSRLQGRVGIHDDTESLQITGLELRGQRLKERVDAPHRVNGWGDLQPVSLYQLENDNLVIWALNE